MMVDMKLDNTLDTAIWIAHSLFQRGKVSGSTANLSFSHNGHIYITGTGSCFGTLTRSDFAKLTKDGIAADKKKPSKEWPLHLKFYQKSKTIQAVIHTHSTYATLWSCLEHENVNDVIPSYTPYLNMKLGAVGLIPYAPPGSQELFDLFQLHLMKENGYLLKNHGPIVGAESLMDAFYCLEELEEGARIAWELEK